MKPSKNRVSGESYLGQLRPLVGQRKLIAVAVRALITDDRGRVLLICRRDNGRWAMPAGCMELEESIEETLAREVREETGLTVTAATLIAVYTHPRYGVTTPDGEPYQYVFFVFRVDAWEGELVTETDETVAARFLALDDWPENTPASYRETLDDALRFDGTVILK